MRTFLNDVRFGLRLLRSNPGFTAVAVVTLALGIAVNTTVFSWVDTVLLRPFRGAADGDRLAVFEIVTPNAPNGGTYLSYVDYGDYRHNLRSISGLALHREEAFNLGPDDSAEARWGELVSGNYFDVLGVRAVLGRVFDAQENDDQVGAHPVVVISHRIWRQRFHSDPAIVGSTLRVNRRDLTIVGVASSDFHGTMPGLSLDLWIPATMAIDLGIFDEAAFRNRDARAFYGIARLKPGVNLKQARAEAATLAQSLERTYPATNTGIGAAVLPVWQFHSGAPELLLNPLRILIAVAGLVLLIACVNVTNLLLARSVARRKEFGMRMALGASGRRLSVQILTETSILTALGALLGLAITPWSADLLVAMIPDIHSPVLIGFELSPRILTFSVLICAGATLIAGSVPAILCLRSGTSDWLKEGGRSGTEGVQTHRTRALLVISEVALACVALIGAGIFVKSFDNARRIHPGFDRDNVLLGRFYLSGSGFTTEELRQFCVRLRDDLRTVPGIVDVSYADYAPLGSSAGPYNLIAVDGYVPARHESMNVNRDIVSPGYFTTLRIPIVQGRDFRESDNADSTPVMVVNETFGRRYFHGGNPLGRKVRLGKTEAIVVGVAKDSKYFNVAEGPRPHFYSPYKQRGRAGRQLYFFIRSSDRPMALAATVRSRIAAAGPRAGAVDLMLLSEWMGVTLLPQKITASMAGALGLISLLLAAVGLYSVMAYSVTQRTREIGIRMALGARPTNVLTNVLRRGMSLTLAGLGVGILGALATVRLASASLVNVSAYDPATFAGATLFLIAVALLACYLPARRATKVDPMTALRCD